MRCIYTDPTGMQIKYNWDKHNSGDPGHYYDDNDLGKSDIEFNASGISGLTNFMSSEWNFSVIQAFGRINIVASMGSLGSVTVSSNGGISSSNKTAAYVTSFPLEYSTNSVNEVPNSQGDSWLETTDEYSGIATTLIAAGTEGINAYIRSGYKSATSWTGWTKLRNSQQAWRTTNTIGKTGSTIFKCLSTTGGIVGGLSTGYSIYKVSDQAINGGLASVNGWDVADATAGIAGTASTIALIIGASNPVGWAIIGIGASCYGAFRAGQYIYENF